MKNQMENWLNKLQDIISKDKELKCDEDCSNRVFDLVRTSIEDKGMKARNRLEIERYVSFFKDMIRGKDIKAKGAEQ